MTQKESRSHLYMIWSSMKRRCENPNMPNYKYYGAKGIKVCGEWHSFPKFKEWAKANGYVDGLSLDRIDSSRDYEPDNCQWMTLSDNATKSLERIVTVDGVEGNVRAWAKLLDCSPGNISYHIYGKGVPVEEFIRRRARYGKNQRVVRNPSERTVKAMRRLNRKLVELTESVGALQGELDFSEEQRLSKSPVLEVTARAGKIWIRGCCDGSVSH